MLTTNAATTPASASAKSIEAMPTLRSPSPSPNFLPSGATIKRESHALVAPGGRRGVSALTTTATFSCADPSPAAAPGGGTAEDHRRHRAPGGGGAPRVWEFLDDDLVQHLAPLIHGIQLIGVRLIGGAAAIDDATPFPTDARRTDYWEGIVGRLGELVVLRIDGY